MQKLWWFIRGVGASDYRALCVRCKQTGQAHYSLNGCVRFKKF